MRALVREAGLPRQPLRVSFPPNCDVHSRDLRWQLYVNSSRLECAISSRSSRPGTTGRRLSAAIPPLVWCNLASNIGVMGRRRGPAVSARRRRSRLRQRQNHFPRAARSVEAQKRIVFDYEDHWLLLANKARTINALECSTEYACRRCSQGLRGPPPPRGAGNRQGQGGWRLPRPAEIPRAMPASPVCSARACPGRPIQEATCCSRATIAKVAKRAA